MVQVAAVNRNTATLNPGVNAQRAPSNSMPSKISASIEYAETGYSDRDTTRGDASRTAHVRALGESSEGPYQ